MGLRIGIDCDGVLRDFIPDVINLIKEKHPEHSNKILTPTDWEWESNKELHKSRFFVSAKLTEINWRHFYKWETDNNYNHNSALNYLIATHPELQKND